VPELTAGPPDEVVRENAFRKARAVADGLPGSGSGAPPAPAPAGPPAAVLGVDTIVVVGGRIFGKPADRGAARATLGELQGREHLVLSGVCLIEGERVRTAAARTRVRFRRLDAAAIDAYLDAGEWRERAGGYAIQERGALLVAGIEGDYLNVVGLPVATLVELAPWLLRGGAAR
jgi:septum formation protein